MPGTKSGGIKAGKANLARDPDFYRKLGALGGRSGSGPKGFAANPERARLAGAKGGKHRHSTKKKAV